MTILRYGNMPVPYTSMWSGEAGYYVDICPAIGARAMCQASARGSGKPDFGKPHMVRQREAMAHHICDLCAKPLRNRTKVSLSHARVRVNGALGPCIMQLEPLLHRECAAISVKHCPNLRKDLKNGRAEIRRVTRYSIQYAILNADGIREYVPGHEIPDDYGTRPEAHVIGHTKVVLEDWRDMPPDWLGAIT